MTVSLELQIKCVRREIALRERVYKRNVELRKMSQPTADRELDAMRAVLETLEWVKWMHLERQTI